MAGAGVRFPVGPQAIFAEVAELVDAIASGAIGSNLVGVQISSSAPGHSVTANIHDSGSCDSGFESQCPDIALVSLWFIMSDMKKVAKNKKMTIDKLAIMVAKGFENTATKDDIKNMATKTDIEGLKGQIEGVNKRIDDFVVTRVKYEDHNSLVNRVQKIEAKI